MALGYAQFDSYDSVGYVLTLHISPPYSLPIQAYVTITAPRPKRCSGLARLVPTRRRRVD
eukprot:COSAG05_NODE_755_length_7517_cov_61.549609_2_plen_60_part_00